MASRRSSSLSHQIIEPFDIQISFENPEYFAPELGRERRFVETHYILADEIKNMSSDYFILIGDLKSGRIERRGFPLNREIELKSSRIERRVFTLGSEIEIRPIKIRYSGAALRYIFSSVDEDFVDLGSEIVGRFRLFLPQVLKLGNPRLGNPSATVYEKTIRKAEKSREFNCPKPWC